VRKLAEHAAKHKFGARLGARIGRAPDPGEDGEVDKAMSDDGPDLGEIKSLMFTHGNIPTADRAFD
jgi:hypothetical protein